MLFEQEKDIPKVNLLLIIFVSFIFIIFLKDFSLLRPISFYITSVHEVCHGLAAILTGGGIQKINLHNSGGFAITQGGFFPLISMAGYIGTASIGSMFLLNSKNLTNIKFILKAFSVIMIITLFVYINSIFNIFFISSILISIAIFYISQYSFAKYIGLILGCLFIMDSFSDARVYLFSKLTGESDIIYQTDTGILANWIGIKYLALPIALMYFTITISIFYFTFKRIIKTTDNI